MINRVCDICGEYVNDVWVLVISRDKDKIEVSGCKEHIDQLQEKHNSIKDNKMSLDKILKQLNLKES